MRYWIEVGQDKAGQALDDRELRALDLLDEVLARPEHVVRFRLEQGDVLWVNNRVMAHNRTGYEDSPGNVRQLQRMWIQCATSQP
jgi:alpha-ketoglutarate-dependent taurine dioxygenase